MPTLHKLTAIKVKSAAPGKYNDGGGLWLIRRHDGGGQWMLRMSVYGRRREMGLGSLGEVSLKEARLEAEKWRAVVRQGKDPIKERKRLQREAARADHTLAMITEEAFEARKAQLKGDGKAGRWLSPLKLHVLPKLGKMPLEEIDQQDIKTALAPIWHMKADTARKAMNRLGIVIRHAAAMGLDVDIQATEKAKALLGKSRHQVKHIASIPWPEVPEFYQSLNENSVTHLALRFLILTAARSSEVRYLHEREIVGDTWVIPAERMKGGKEHRVPLSSEAQAVLKQAAPYMRDGHLFPSVRKGVISDATMSRMMERRGLEARPHGFRSSFRTWCEEATKTRREVAETALAHVSGGSVERSYRRTDYLDKRRILMESWANHVTAVQSSDNVVKMLDVS